MKHGNSARAAFTLIEIAVVLAVIGLLAALLFPVFGRARQSGQQTRCSSNLQQIYLAARQYHQDDGHFPNSLETLLPAGSVAVYSSGGYDPSMHDGGTSRDPIFDNEDPSLTSSPATGEDEVIRTITVGMGYLKTRDVARCLSDSEEHNAFTTSYGIKRASIWNFYGYGRHGFELRTQPPSMMRLFPDRPFNTHSNPVKYSLANRFAPTSTIITHCIFHRPWTSKLSAPYDLGTPSDGGQGNGASDIVLRLDGSTRLSDVSRFAGPSGQPKDNRWQFQTP